MDPTWQLWASSLQILESFEVINLATQSFLLTNRGQSYDYESYLATQGFLSTNHGESYD